MIFRLNTFPVSVLIFTHLLEETAVQWAADRMYFLPDLAEISTPEQSPLFPNNSTTLAFILCSACDSLAEGGGNEIMIREGGADGEGIGPGDGEGLAFGAGGSEHADAKIRNIVKNLLRCFMESLYR